MSTIILKNSNGDMQSMENRVNNVLITKYGVGGVDLLGLSLCELCKCHYVVLYTWNEFLKF